MSFDDSSEIKRLRRELEEITAERDYLLRENRRLTQTSPVKQSPIRAITDELVKEAVPSVNAVKQSDSISSPRFRNRLLKLIIDRVELKGTESIKATIFWKADFKQTVTIERHLGKRKRLTTIYWKGNEDAILKERYPHLSPEALAESFPGRTPKGIERRAQRLGLQRIIQDPNTRMSRKYSDKDKPKTKYATTESVRDLDRSNNSDPGRVTNQKLLEPIKTKKNRQQFIGENDKPSFFQSSPLGDRMRVILRLPLTFHSSPSRGEEIRIAACAGMTNGCAMTIEKGIRYNQNCSDKQP